MMNRTISIICLLTALFVLPATVLLAPAAAGAGTTTLTYSNFFPPTHIQSKLAESWCREVEKRTEGRIKIQYFAGQTLTKANQTYDSVIDGIADIGFSAFAYTRGRFPVMGAIDLPLGYPTGIAATRITNEIYKQFQPKELKDTQVMYLHAHGPGMIHTRNKAVHTLEDLKGLKIRSTGISAELVKALGATPVPMPMPESYQSLQKGVVDGCANPLETNKGWKLGEVVKYVAMAYPVAYTTSFFVVMNKNKWNALEPKDREIIEGINAEWAEKHGNAWDTSDTEGLRFFFQNGDTAIGIGEKEAERWKAAVAPVIDDYAKQLDQKGIKGEEIINAIRQKLAQYQQ